VGPNCDPGLTTLYSFCSQGGCTDGDRPLAGLVQATNGDLYGTAEYGGANKDGTVFNLSVGLGPFVKHCLLPARLERLSKFWEPI